MLLVTNAYSVSWYGAKHFIHITLYKPHYLWGSTISNYILQVNKLKVENQIIAQDQNSYK